MLSTIALTAVFFLVLWISSGIAVNSIEKLSKTIKINSFLVSFFALGLFTSLGEISVSVFSLIDKTPNMAVGNLVGASIVLTLLIIPLHAIINKQATVKADSQSLNLSVAYLVISLPVLLMLDGKLGIFDAVLIIFSYIYLLFTLSDKKSILEKLENTLMHPHVNVYREVTNILIGSGMIVISSKYIVDNLVTLSQAFNIAPFIVGLLLLSIGTNIPELTILIRSYRNHQRGIALGDYVGSASLNSFVMGMLILLNGEPIIIDRGLKLNVLLLPLGAIFFLIFARNKVLERREGYVLLSLYFLFIALEFLL